jgi:GNAT superfamily N-acetyltransferase
MHDMLVRLYALPDLAPALAHCAGQGVAIRRALTAEKAHVTGWVRRHFPSAEAETETAFARLPVTCFIAVRAQLLLGFACFDATAPNFFGPEGVAESVRGQGVGTALLLAALHAQRAQGFAYAIIGGVGPAAFYAKVAGAVDIADSTPGIYAGILPRIDPAN